MIELLRSTAANIIRARTYYVIHDKIHTGLEHSVDCGFVGQ